MSALYVCCRSSKERGHVTSNDVREPTSGGHHQNAVMSRVRDGQPVAGAARADLPDQRQCVELTVQPKNISVTMSEVQVSLLIYRAGIIAVLFLPQPTSSEFLNMLFISAQAVGKIFPSERKYFKTLNI